MPQIDTVHIGLPKCASNLLQRDLLANHAQVNLITPKFVPDLKADFAAFLAMNCTFDESAFWNKLGPLLSHSPEKRNIISQEGLSGDMITGAHSETYAEKLLSLFGSTTVIIVIREPFSYLYSAYRHMISRGHSYSLKRFLLHYGVEKRTGLTYSPGATLFDRVRYIELIQFYTTLIGPHNVRVLLYEDLLYDSLRFLSELATFLSIKTPHLRQTHVYNKGINRPGLMSWVNWFSANANNSGKFRILPKSLGATVGIADRQIRPLIGVEQRLRTIRSLLPRDEMEGILNSNFQLAAFLGRDLERYGYSME